MAEDLNSTIIRLEERVRVYEKVIDTLRDELVAVHKDIIELNLNIATSGKTKWGILISFCGMVITVMTILGSLVINPIQKDVLRLYDAQSKLEDKVNANERVSHAEIEARNAAIDAAIRDLNSRRNRQ